MRLIRTIANLQKDGPLAVLSAVRKAGLLTGLKTFARNISGNTGFQVLEETSRLPSVLATGSTCDIDVVECVVTDQTDVFSAGFAVTYPSAVVDYLGYSVEGSVLRSDGAVLKVLEQKEAGRVTIGIARTDVTTGINVTGSAVLISLRFGKRSTVTASGALAFENGRLLGSETPPQEKPGIRWTGGTLAVN